MADLATVATCLVLGANPSLIGAIIEVESQWNESAFNVNKWDGADYQNASIPHAAAAAKVFIENGYTVDVGLMQINSVNLKKYDVAVLDAFDVCTNVRLGEKILMSAIEEANRKGASGEIAIQKALSVYNTGNESFGFKNGYVDKVWSVFYNRGDHASLFSDTEVDMAVNTDMFDYTPSLAIDIKGDD